MVELTKMKCVPCEGGVPPIKGKKLSDLRTQLDANWKVVKQHQLEREFPFPDFKQAWSFTDKVAKLAEQEGHHPDIVLAWGRVHVTTWTHAINGLSDNDFILAAKIDKIWNKK